MWVKTTNELLRSSCCGYHWSSSSYLMLDIHYHIIILWMHFKQFYILRNHYSYKFSDYWTDIYIRQNLLLHIKVLSNKEKQGDFYVKHDAAYLQYKWSNCLEIGVLHLFESLWSRKEEQL